MLNLVAVPANTVQQTAQASKPVEVPALVRSKPAPSHAIASTVSVTSVPAIAIPETVSLLSKSNSTIAAAPFPSPINAVATQQNSTEKATLVQKSPPVQQPIAQTPQPSTQEIRAVQLNGSTPLLNSPNLLSETAQPSSTELVFSREVTQPVSTAAIVAPSDSSNPASLNSAPAILNSDTQKTLSQTFIAPLTASPQQHSIPSGASSNSQTSNSQVKAESVAPTPAVPAPIESELTETDKTARETQLRNDLIAKAYQYAAQGKFEDARQMLQNPVVPSELRFGILSTINSMEPERSLPAAQPKAVNPTITVKPATLKPATLKPATLKPATLKQRRFEQAPVAARLPIVPRAVKLKATPVLVQVPQDDRQVPIVIQSRNTPVFISRPQPISNTGSSSAVAIRSTAMRSTAMRSTAPTLQAYAGTLPNPGTFTPGVLTPLPSGEGLVYPLPSPVPVTSGYGWRTHPVTRVRKFHSGVDLGAAHGTPILATRGGRVSVANRLGGYGLAVVIEHQNGTQDTLYGHMSEILVRPGAELKPGTIIGRVGSTGVSTGPHLHYEARLMNNSKWLTVDPGGQLEAAKVRLMRAASNS